MGCGASAKKKAETTPAEGGADASKKQNESPGEAVAQGAKDVAKAGVSAGSQAVGAKKMKVHIGPLEVGSDGVVAKPKFNFGIQGGAIYAMAGVRDVRDGAAVEAMGMVMKTYSTEGDTLTELLENVKAEEHIKAIDDLITTIPDIIAAVLELCKADIKTNCENVEGCVYIYTGAGVSAGMYFGWLDTNGYNMVGVEGKVAAAASLALTVKAGVHESKKSVRVTAYLANVGFDSIVTLKEPLVA